MMLVVMRASLMPLAGVLLVPGDAGAQNRLLSNRSLGGGVRFESMSFGDAGVPDGDSSASGGRIKRATQVVVPFGASVALGEAWSVDLAGAYTSGEIEYSGASAGGNNPSLNGVSDLRLRATGKILGDNLLLSLGVNVPTGATTLDQDQLAALRVLAAPGLGFQLPSVGFGPSGAVGLVGTRTAGDWVVALGASYEYRGKFSPIAALQAGANPDYDPGNSIHLSLGLERFVGDNRLSLQTGADLFSEDRLSLGSTNAQVVRLGPIISLDAILDVSGEGLRDARLFASAKIRSSFQRDDSTVAGSSGTYLNAGFEGGLPLRRSVDLRFAVDGLAHSGLDVDNTLMTAKATMAGATLGLRIRSGGLWVDPFVRAVVGNIDPGVGSASTTGMTFGLSVTTRF